jgi:hypothetical protein
MGFVGWGDQAVCVLVDLSVFVGKDTDVISIDLAAQARAFQVGTSENAIAIFAIFARKIFNF